MPHPTVAFSRHLALTSCVGACLGPRLNVNSAWLSCLAIGIALLPTLPLLLIVTELLPTPHRTALHCSPRCTALHSTAPRAAPFIVPFIVPGVTYACAACPCLPLPQQPPRPAAVAGEGRTEIIRPATSYSRVQTRAHPTASMSGTTASMCGTTPATAAVGCLLWPGGGRTRTAQHGHGARHARPLGTDEAERDGRGRGSG